MKSFDYEIIPSTWSKNLRKKKQFFIHFLFNSEGQSPLNEIRENQQSSLLYSRGTKIYGSENLRQTKFEGTKVLNYHGNIKKYKMLRVPLFSHLAILARSLDYLFFFKFHMPSYCSLLTCLWQDAFWLALRARKVSFPSQDSNTIWIYWMLFRFLPFSPILSCTYIFLVLTSFSSSFIMLFHFLYLSVHTCLRPDARWVFHRKIQDRRSYIVLHETVTVLWIQSRIQV